MELYLLTCFGSAAVVLLVCRFYIDKLRAQFAEELYRVVSRNENKSSLELVEMQAAYQSQIEALNHEHFITLQQATVELEHAHQKAMAAAVEAARVSSRRQTKAVRFGNAAQHSLLPIMAAQEEGIDPRDIRWLGGTFDFVVFKNLHRSPDQPVEIIFADAKTSVRVSELIENKDKANKYKKYDPAHAFFSEDQVRIAQAIERGDISYQLWMADSETEQFEVKTYSSDSPSKHFGNWKEDNENNSESV